MPFHATSRPRAKAGAGEARSGTISVRDGNARQGPESRVLLHVVRWGLTPGDGGIADGPFPAAYNSDSYCAGGKSCKEAVFS